jgi:hypothetical protein
MDIVKSHKMRIPSSWTSIGALGSIMARIGSKLARMYSSSSMEFPSEVSEARLPNSSGGKFKERFGNLVGAWEVDGTGS